MMIKDCKTCLQTKPITDFPAGKRRSGSLYYRPHCYSCKYNKEVLSGRVPDKEYHRSYAYKNKLDFRYKAYKHGDKTKGFLDTLEQYTAFELMMKPCHWCDKEGSGGLDRLDNSKGHSEDNVVPCCEKCNNILGDIPYSAKLLLKQGLTEINKQGLLEEWQIPTKRKK